jgi:thiamine-monophosphate kinase
MAGEFDFIRWLRTQQKPSELVPLPAGDDMAVLRWNADDDLLLVGVDQVLDGVHFDSAVHSPRAIGRKVMNRNLSDCAAMACLPAAAVVTIAAPRGAGEEYLRELYLGMKEAGDVFDCAIVGGDTGSWAGKLAVGVTILGRSGGVTPITRGGAKVGDRIYVTGPLGGSILGRHVTFEPRVALARQLARDHRVTAMIDLSDGLSRDLGHICRESGVGADVGRVPVHDDAFTLARREGTDRPDMAAVQHALHDGEDYELLFTSPDDIPFGTPYAFGIGIITAEHRGKIHLTSCLDGVPTSEPLEPKGWEHSL